MEPKLRHSGAEIFIPDRKPVDKGMTRTTHLAIAAHPDDMEILAYDGILKCFESDKEWFFGIIVTDGGGSPRGGPYTNYSDEEMKKVRRKEQKKAAVIGEYAGVAFLNYPSSEVRDPKNPNPKEDIKELLTLAKPSVIYTHNLADKHNTHVAVALRTIEGLRELPEELKPSHLYGCEVWGGLDWLVDEDKVVFDVSAHENLASSLLGVYDSQIWGGKKYDLATLGRRRANATYYASHAVDVAASMSFNMDLTPLIKDPTLDIREFILIHINRFAEDVKTRIEELL
ncbi:MAG: PIG-L family deacetylase [Acidobacteriota bacterium]